MLFFNILTLYIHAVMMIALLLHYEFYILHLFIYLPNTFPYSSSH